MSTTIDNRVVEMQFDNRQFERNVATSMSTLEKLKQSLNLTGAAKGLEDVNVAARGFGSTGLGSAVDAVQAKFSALQVIGVTALANITNSAVNAGKRLVSAFTIDPVKTGLAEYETQINAVQTILANTESKGTTLDDVNQALDTLNTYADKTIYNFTEMTRNIGTFTAAGTDLDTSVNAIQGISNLAAVSGSTSQQASTAMYQLSQALASGTVKLMDWNSVVNAGMGGQVFQDALKETARVHGVAIDKMIEDEGSFRETLKGEWLTSEILTETLAKFTMATEGLTEAEIEKNRQILKGQGYTEEQIEGIFKLGNTATNAATKVKTASQLMDTLKEAAQSGWTQTWELLIGDFEEAKELWTGVSDVVGGFINSTSEARNTLLGGTLNSNWEKLTGEIKKAGITTTEFEEKIRSVAESHNIDLDKMIEEHGSLAEAFKSGAISSDILQEAVNGLKNKFGELLNIERELNKGTRGDDVKQIQAALSAVGHTEVGAVDGIFGKKTEAAVKAFQKANNMKVTGVIDQDTLEALDSAAKKTNTLTDSVDDLIANITKLGGREKIIQSLKNIFDGFVNILKPIKEAFRDIFPPITSDQLYGLIEKFEALTQKFKAFTEKQGPNIKATFVGIFSALDIGLDFLKAVGSGIVNLLSNFTGLTGGLLDMTASIGSWIKGLRDSVRESNTFGNIVDKIIGFLQKGIDKIHEFTDSLVWKDFYTFLSKIGETIASIASSITNSIGDIFTNGDLHAGIATMNSGIFATILLGVKKYIDGITEAFSFDWSNIKFFDVLKETFDSVRESLQTWQQNLKASILLKIAAAIGILAASLFVIATIDSAKLASALGAITVLFADLIGTLSIFDKMGGVYAKATKAAVLMLGISVSVLILASALKKLSDLGWGELAKGIVGVAALTAILVKATKAMSTDQGKIMSGALNLVVFAAAMKVLVSACEDISNLDWDELARGLVGVGALMLEVAAFLNFTKNSKNAIGTATGVVILAAGIKILASACRDFATMGWEDLSKGLVSIGLLLLEIAAFTKLTGNAGNVITTATSLVIISAAMKIFASTISDLGKLTWEEIAKGLVSIGAALVAVAIAVHVMPKNIISIGVGLTIVAGAIMLLTDALSEMSNMTWEGIGKSFVALGGSLLILAVGLHAMKGAIGGSAALLVTAAALSVLTPCITNLGEMSWGAIIRSLVALAGAFTVIGLAAYILAPITPAILALSVALLAIGAGCALAGIGISAMALAFTSLAASLVVATSSIISSIILIAKGLGDIIVAACDSIVAAAPSLAEAFVAIIQAACHAIIGSLPLIAETFLTLILQILDAVKTYVPQIVDVVMDIIISIFDSLTGRMPELAESGVKMVGAFIEALSSALGNDGLEALIRSIECIAGIFIALGITAKIISTIPISGALSGIASLGIVVGGIAAILSILGGLAQIPGFNWIVGEGSKVLGAIGTAIGTFVGNIIGGVAEGISNSLPQIGSNLSSFMTNSADFIAGAKNIDASVLEGVAVLAAAIIAITATEVISAIGSFLSGGSTIASFGEDLVVLGAALKGFSDNVSGIDAATVGAAVEAARALAEMANIVPNEGGMAAWFAGENSLAAFGPQMVDFGSYLKQFSDNVSGVDPTTVVAAANAAKALAEMANIVPNEGGMAAWFAGENSLATFGPQMASFGIYLKQFAENVSGIDPATITAAAEAGKTLAEMANTIPNEGGVAAWFAGENSLSSFGSQIASFGGHLKAFAENVAGIDPASVATAVEAGKSLVDMANTIPNEGGVVAWFAGDNSLATFGSNIASFGGHLKSFAENVVGIDPMAVTAAAEAGKALAEMANTIPNEGGMAAWFAGENSLATFSDNLPGFGTNLASFVANLGTFGDDQVSTVGCVVSAIKELALATNTLPNEGGITAWFGGENSLTTFSSNLPGLGTNMASFVSNLGTFTEDQVSTVKCVASALKELATAANTIPNEGGLAAWFAGDNSIATFSANLPGLGSNMALFVSNLGTFTEAQVTTVYSAINAIKAFGTLAGSDLSSAKKNIEGFGDKLAGFGSDLADFCGELGEATNVDSAVSNMNKIVDAAKGITDGSVTAIKDLGGALKDFGKDGVKGFVSSFTSEESKKSVKDAAAKLAEQVVDGVETKTSNFKKACTDLASAGASAIKTEDIKSKFTSAGKYVVTGFASGITENSFKAEAAATAMASAALAAAKEVFDEHSPSREFFKIGRFVVEGLANGIAESTSMAVDSSGEMANDVIKGTQSILAKVSDYVVNGIDTEPTIRPVLDMSDLTSKAGKISGLFDMNPSVGLMTNIGAISRGMNGRQNGTATDIINELSNLGKKLENAGGNTYNSINGITYSDGSELSEAIQTIVRLATIERRV